MPNFNNQFALLLLFAVLWSSAVVAQSDRPRFKLIAGYDYSSGDYGTTQDSSFETVPISVKAETDNWVGKLQFSSVTLKQENMTPDGTIDSNTSSGSGDTLLYVARKSVFRWKGENYIDWGLKTKIPTASEEKGLGTGEPDWMLQIDGFRSHGRWLPFVTAGYRWRGDSENLDRKDGFYGSLGLHYQHNKKLSAGSILDFRSASTVRIEDGQELIPYVGYKLNKRISLTAYGVFGLSDGSTDQGAGLQMVIRF